jgi:hypothetical protein
MTAETFHTLIDEPYEERTFGGLTIKMPRKNEFKSSTTRAIETITDRAIHAQTREQLTDQEVTVWEHVITCAQEYSVTEPTDLIKLVHEEIDGIAVRKEEFIPSVPIAEMRETTDTATMPEISKEDYRVNINTQLTLSLKENIFQEEIEEQKKSKPSQILKRDAQAIDKMKRFLTRVAQKEHIRFPITNAVLGDEFGIPPRRIDEIIDNKLIKVKTKGKSISPEIGREHAIQIDYISRLPNGNYGLDFRANRIQTDLRNLVKRAIQEYEDEQTEGVQRKKPKRNRGRHTKGR